MNYRDRIELNSTFTTFQKKVLLAILKIPRGEVRSYARVAKIAGYEGAARAVGQVCRINPYAPHVPCHRVIASGGKLGGYSGGPAKKRKLLREEGLGTGVTSRETIVTPVP